MGKYLIAYKNAVHTHLQYRLHLGLILVSHGITLTGLTALWVSVYHSGQALPGYTLSQIITYYILITFLRSTIADGVGMGFQVVAEIHDGFVTNYLLKPFSYALEQLMKSLGQATVNSLCIVPPMLIMAFLLRHSIPLPSFSGWLIFFFLMFLALILYFLIYFLIALASFWVERGRSFIFGALVVSMFLNGAFLPLDLFPAWSRPVIQALPFHYLSYTPVAVFLNHQTSTWSLFLPVFLWMIFFTLMIRLVWHLGVKKFEAVGR